jgi:PAX-interacting protein 1
LFISYLATSQVNHALIEEIQEINKQLIDTELHVSEDDAESFTTSDVAEGTVIKCTFTAVAVSPSLKSMFASAQMVRQPQNTFAMFLFFFFLLRGPCLYVCRLTLFYVGTCGWQSPILPLRLLVPGSYPKCSPVLLDKFPDEQWCV